MLKNPVRKVILAVLAAMTLMVALPAASYAATSARERDLVTIGSNQKQAVVAEDWPVGSCTALGPSTVTLTQEGSHIIVETRMRTWATEDDISWRNTILVRTASNTVVITTNKQAATWMRVKNTIYTGTTSYVTNLDPGLFPYLTNVRWLADCS